MPQTTLRGRVFEFALLCCLAFVFLTALAMALYPGGTKAHPEAQGYSFLGNFFSDLGRVQALDGKANTLSAALFAFALSLAGLGLMLFFTAFAGLFWHSLWMRVAALWGALLGIAAGYCFIGVAATPFDINSHLHGAFVLWAFRSFFLAVLPFALAIFGAQGYPKVGAWLFLAFAVGLASYILLISLGPSSFTRSGLIIQVTGQKLIVYASILCIGLQSVIARQFLRETCSSSSPSVG